MSRIFIPSIVIVLAVLLLSPSASPDEGKLDSYGCHYDHERNNYHCHEGTFKGASFNSKIEMIRQLKLQFLNLGRPWPYDDIAEDDITSSDKQIH
jgi:hypothetical protein